MKLLLLALMVSGSQPADSSATRSLLRGKTEVLSCPSPSAPHVRSYRSSPYRFAPVNASPSDTTRQTGRRTSSSL